MDQSEPHPVPDSNEAPAETVPAPQVPWEKRKQIGRIRAYWRTAWMVMIRPRDLEQFLDAPVCEKHAKKFRRVTFQLTVLVTAGVLAVALLQAFAIMYRDPDSGYNNRSNISAIALSLVFSEFSLIWLFLATRSLEWFSCPRSFDPVRQDRAVAISCYVCAPILIVTVVGGIASLAAILLCERPDLRPVMYAIALTWWAVFLVWWPASVRALHFTTGQSAKRTTIAAIGLPLVWAGQHLLVAYIPISLLHWFLMSCSLF